MAFTPDGMFYLGKEDLAPTIGLAGTGVRGMLGLQNKKEAVDSLMQSGDFSTPESRRAILEQIRAVDPDAYQKYARENQEWEAKELGLAAKAGEPALKQVWRNIEGPASSMRWATAQLSVYGVTPDEILGLTSIGAITNKIVQLAKDEEIEKGAAGKLITAYKAQMKEDKEYYMDMNKYNPPYSASSKQTRDINSIQGRGAYANTA